MIDYIISNSETAIEALVDNWLTDVQRRGAELYALNKVNRILYLSFQGKDQLRLSVEIDLDVRDVMVQTTGSERNSVERKVFLLNEENLQRKQWEISVLLAFSRGYSIRSGLALP